MINRRCWTCMEMLSTEMSRSNTHIILFGNPKLFLFRFCAGCIKYQITGISFWWFREHTCICLISWSLWFSGMGWGWVVTTAVLDIPDQHFNAPTKEKTWRAWNSHFDLYDGLYEGGTPACSVMRVWLAVGIHIIWLRHSIFRSNLTREPGFSSEDHLMCVFVIVYR